eukprot:5474599-Pyramimonas_sp.AAC.1
MDMQISEGRHAFFERPFRALSWQRPEIKALSQVEGMRKIKFDMCMFGMVSPIEKAPLKNTTLFLTNVDALAPKMSKKMCRGTHSMHNAIEGMEGNIKLSKWAQKCPDPLCEAIAEAISDL